MTVSKKTVVPVPRRRGRPPKGTRGDTRQELLDAALRLFARQGYSATTVRQIADEVGIRDSAIYVHFNAKNELLDALIHGTDQEIRDHLQLDTAHFHAHPPASVLPELVDQLVRFWDKPRHRQIISLLTREGLAEMPVVLGGVDEALAHAFNAWRAEAVLTAAAAPGVIRWEFTAPLAAIRILNLNADSSPTQRRSGRQRARDHVQYFLSTALRQPPGRGRSGYKRKR